jgi:hypothetical protein
MIWTPWKPLRLSNPPATQARKRLAGEGAILLVAVFLVLSGTATAYSLLKSPTIHETQAARVTEAAAAVAARETPGYGVSGYFSLEGEGGSEIRVVPRPPAVRPALDIQLQGGRLRVTSPRMEGGMLAMRLVDARGRVVRTWSETLPAGGAAVLTLDGKMRGLLILQVDGGALGRAVKMVPPLRADAW